MSAGRRSGSFTAAASSTHESRLAGTPATSRPPPSPITMSSGLASSRCAASCLACASTSSLARNSALPPICSDRDPPVPPPRDTSAVSECTHADVFHRDTERVADDHRERRLVALAVRARADPCGHLAVGLDLDRAVLTVERERRADLEVRRDTDAEHLRVAALAPRRLLGAQRVVAGLLERDVERLRVLAAVVDRTQPGDRRERERLGRDEVLAPDLDRIDAELVGRDVEGALDEVDRLGPAGAAVRGDRRGVRDRGLPVELDLRDDVHVLRHHLREERQERADRRVRTRVGQRAHAQTGDLAVALQAHLDVVHVPAAVPHRDHVLGARLGPLHRPAEQQRGLGDDQVLDDEPGLRAEPAADRRVRAAHDRRGRARASPRARRARRAGPASRRRR